MEVPQTKAECPSDASKEMDREVKADEGYIHVLGTEFWAQL